MDTEKYKMPTKVSLGNFFHLNDIVYANPVHISTATESHSKINFLGKEFF